MNWMTCLICIPLFALVPFIALVWFLRNGAPTNLRTTGAIAGLLAGAIGATADVPGCRAGSQRWHFHSAETSHFCGPESKAASLVKVKPAGSHFVLTVSGWRKP
jgi:hypothetical protein